MNVPKGKTIYIGNRKHKSGDKLPDTYVFPEKKKKETFTKEVKEK